MAEITLDMKELAKRQTAHLTLTNYKSFRWRVWLGKQLFRLAFCIMWMGVEFDEDDGVIGG